MLRPSLVTNASLGLGLSNTNAPPVDNLSEPKQKPTAALRTVLAPALAEPQATSQSRSGALPRPLKSSRWRARCALRDPRPFAAHTSCVLLAVRHPRCVRCGRRCEGPLGTRCRVFRAAELCGAGRMQSAAGGLPRSAGVAMCGPSVPVVVLAPLRVTVVAALAPRSAAGGLPLVPFGYSQHVVASLRNFRSPRVTGRGRNACDPVSFRWLLRCAQPSLRSRWRGDRGWFRCVAARVRHRCVLG